MRIITNADDLGISAQVNAVVFDLMADGVVTSATIIANAPATQDACRGARRFPACSFGIHLNLTEFSPLNAASTSLAPMLAASGEFDGRIRETRGLYRLSSGIYAEWCAQVDALASRGIAISHIDSHKHVHTIPALFPVLKAVQRRYGIRRVRISRNVYGQNHSPPKPLVVGKRAFNAALRRLYATRTTDAFTDLATYIGARDDLEGRFQSLELELHPGASFSGEDSALLRSLDQADSEFRGRLITYFQI